jgi:two-component system sensor histidine kinase DctS
MIRTPATSADHTLDFAMLQQSASRHAGRNRRVLWLMLGLLALLLGAVVSLLLYLRSFEDAEAARRRAADAQWLEQSVQFHFRRLEDDLLLLARHSAPHANHGYGKRVDPGVQFKVMW